MTRAEGRSAAYVLPVRAGLADGFGPEHRPSEVDTAYAILTLTPADVERLEALCERAERVFEETDSRVGALTVDDPGLDFRYGGFGGNALADRLTDDLSDRLDEFHLEVETAEMDGMGRTVRVDHLEALATLDLIGPRASTEVTVEHLPHGRFLDFTRKLGSWEPRRHGSLARGELWELTMAWAEDRAAMLPAFRGLCEHYPRWAVRWIEGERGRDVLEVLEPSDLRPLLGHDNAPFREAALRAVGRMREAGTVRVPDPPSGGRGR